MELLKTFIGSPVTIFDHSGLYLFNQTGIFKSYPGQLLFNNQIVYYDISLKRFYGDMYTIHYITEGNVGAWHYLINDTYRNEFSYGAASIADEYYVPTMKAVKKYVKDQIAYYGRHSTSEEKEIGTWLDGKTLYEKTFRITNIPQVTTDGTSVNTQTSISSLNCEMCYIENAFARSTNTRYGGIQTLPYINDSGYQFKTLISIDNYPDSISLVSNGTAYNNYYEVYVVIHYTKRS